MDGKVPLQEGLEHPDLPGKSELYLEQGIGGHWKFTDRGTVGWFVHLFLGCLTAQ